MIPFVEEKNIVAYYIYILIYYIYKTYYANNNIFVNNKKMAKVLDVSGENVKIVTGAPVTDDETDLEGSTTPMVIKRDEKGKIDMKHMKLAWQHYLQNRPVQNESLGIPWGFQVDKATKTIVCDKVTGKPKSTWKNIYDVPIKEFSDLGIGTKLTFDFMRETGGFFFFVWIFGCLGWVIELANPMHIFWVDVTFVWDMMFVCMFIGYMVYVRRDMTGEHRVLDELNITSKLIDNHLKYLQYNINKNKSLINSIKSDINYNQSTLDKLNNLLNFFKNNFNISGDNIIGNTENIYKILDLDSISHKESIEKYIRFYNIDYFNVEYYLIEIDLYNKFNENKVKNSIKKWMAFHEINTGIKPEYIFEVINSSAGIHGWSK